MRHHSTSPHNSHITSLSWILILKISLLFGFAYLFFNSSNFLSTTPTIYSPLHLSTSHKPDTPPHPSPGDTNPPSKPSEPSENPKPEPPKPTETEPKPPKPTEPEPKPSEEDPNKNPSTPVEEQNSEPSGPPITPSSKYQPKVREYHYSLYTNPFRKVINLICLYLVPI